MTARTRIKICGIRDVQSARAAVDAGADAIGLVFIPKSPRFLLPEDALPILRALPPFVDAVGLFADAPTDTILDITRRLALRTVQLHAQESPALVAQLHPLRVIKAIPFDPDDIRDRLAPWCPPPPNLAAILWDAPPPRGSHITGGHGRRFDWEALHALHQSGALRDLPLTILAGGLTPQNVGEGVQIVRPFAVDVSSGVESAPGIKDPAKIAAFCAAVRQADQHDSRS